ncbi:hypothetical protein RI367_007746 [Sorochytrium milnesiophthora]
MEKTPEVCLVSGELGRGSDPENKARKITLLNIPADVLEHIGVRLDSLSGARLAIVAQNPVFDALLLKHLFLLKLWQSADDQVVRWLIKSRAAGVSHKSWTVAAEHGWMDVIVYLHQHHAIWYSPEVVDCAAKNDHIDILRWLVERNARGASSKLWIVAAERGWMDTIVELHQRHGIAYSSSVMDHAAEHGHMDIVRFLMQHRTEGCTERGILFIVQHGNDNDLAFFSKLQFWRLKPHIQRALAAYGTLSAFIAAHPEFPRNIRSETVCTAMRNGRVDVIKHIVEAGRQERFNSGTIVAAVGSGNRDLIDYLLERCRTSFTAHAIRAAAQKHDLRLLRQLIEKAPVSHSRRCDPDDPGNIATTMGMYITQTDQVTVMRFNLRRELFGRGAQLCDHWWSTMQQQLAPELAATGVVCDCNDCSKIRLLHLAAPKELAAWAGSADDRRAELLDLMHHLQPDVQVRVLYWALRPAIVGNDAEAVRHLLQRFPDIAVPDVTNLAAQNGHLAIVQMLHEHTIMPCTTSAMDCAASNGHLEVVKFLHQHRSEGCTKRAMDRAAFFGFLDVVKFLHENRDEGCTTEALENAAANGHLDVVKFLHENRSEGCTTRAMDRAAAFGQVEVIKFLHHNRTEGCTTNAMDYAAAAGHLDTVKFLHENRSEGCTTRAMDNAAKFGQLDVIKFLHYHRPEGCTSQAMEAAVYGGHLETVEFLHQHRPQWWPSHSAIYAAAQKDNFRLVKFLHFNMTLSCTPQALQLAIERGDLAMAQFLLRRRKECHLAGVIEMPLHNDTRDLLAFLYQYTPADFTEDNFALAARNRQLDIVKFMCESGLGRDVRRALAAAKHQSNDNPAVISYLAQALQEQEQ